MENLINRRFYDQQIISMSELRTAPRKGLCLSMLGLMFANLKDEIKNYEVDGKHDLLIEVKVSFRDAALERKMKAQIDKTVKRGFKSGQEMQREACKGKTIIEVLNAEKRL